MKNYVCSFFLILGLICSVNSQELLPSQQYETAQEKASSGDYPAAISILKQLTEAYPGNYDYQLYLARVYSWNEEYLKAISILKELSEEEKYNSELMQVLVSVQLWAGEYEEVIQNSDKALTQENNNFYRIQKAQALKALNREKEALGALDEVLVQDPEHTEALFLQTQIFKESSQQLSFSYMNTSFSQPGSSPRHMSYLEYKRELGAVPVLARYNYGYLHGKGGGMIEVDAYPKVSKNSYLFLNLGAALDTPIFPELRAGAEYFIAMNNGLGISVGSKYLRFTQDEVFMFTGELSYYTKKNLKMSYRPFISESEKKWFLSHAVALKLLNPLKESFWQLDLQYGSVPFGFYTSADFKDLSAYRLGLQYQFRLGRSLLMQPVLMYEYEEYLPSQFRNRINAQIVTTLRF